jgi:exonuclease VII large subunit
MADIRSAREIALEKVERMGEATEEERMKWKYHPDGAQMAARYLKEEYNLVGELSRFPEDARRYVRAGAAEVLIRNISLPKNDSAKNANRKAMEGLRLLKNDKAQLENTFSRMRQLFSHYVDQGDKQRKQAFQTVKTDLEARIRPEIEKQMGSFSRAKIDVEKLPQFQQEWRKVLNQLDSQYLTLLTEYKEGLAAIT